VPGLELPATLYADMSGSLMAAEAVLQAALRKHERYAGGGDPHPEGLYLEVALSDAAGYLALPHRWGLTQPQGSVGGAHAGYRVYPCKDGAWPSPRWSRTSRPACAKRRACRRRREDDVPPGDARGGRCLLRVAVARRTGLPGHGEGPAPPHHGLATSGPRTGSAALQQRLELAVLLFPQAVSQRWNRRRNAGSVA
jgi:hypothetical protein